MIFVLCYYERQKVGTVKILTIKPILFAVLQVRKNSGHVYHDIADAAAYMFLVLGRTVSLDHPHRLVSHPKRVEAHQSPRQNNLRAGGNNNSNAVDDAQVV